MSCEEVASKCAQELKISDDVSKSVRAFLLCLAAQLKLRPISVNVGPKFSYLMYFEFKSAELMEQTFNLVVQCIYKAASLTSDPTSSYLRNYNIISWKLEKHIMFNKEWLVFKFVW